MKDRLTFPAAVIVAALLAGLVLLKLDLRPRFALPLAVIGLALGAAALALIADLRRRVAGLEARVEELQHGTRAPGRTGPGGPG